MMEKPRLRMIGVLILVGAFVARLAYLLQVKDLPFYYHPTLDTGFFHGWAIFKMKESWLDAAVSFREPLYAYFLGLIYSGFRESMNLARVIQSILGGVTAMLVFSIGRRIYGAAAGIIAAFLFALAGPALFFASELNEVTLTLLLLSAGAYFLVRANDDRPYLNCGLSGLCFGAAFLSSLAAVAALPASLIACLGSKNRRVKKAVTVLVIGFLIAPFCYHLLLLRTDQRAVFQLRSSWQAFLGSGATGGRASRASYETSIAGQEGAYRAIALPSRIEGQRDALRFAAIEDPSIETPVEAHRHWGHRVMDDLASDPLAYFGNYFAKLGLFWGRSLPAANLDIRYLEDYSWLLKTRVFSFAVIAALGLVGLVFGSRRELLHLSIFIPLSSVIVALYLVSDIGKALVLPFLCVFGGYVVSEAIGGVRRGETPRAATMIVAAVVAGVLVYLLPAERMDRVGNLTAVGDVYAEVAVFDRAEALYREAIEHDPDRPEPYVSLAKLYGNTGKAEAGVEILNTGAGRGIGDPRIGIEKASLLIILGRHEQALRGLEEVKRTHPYEPRLHQLMGLSHLERGRPDLALEDLERELDYAGGGFITYSALGRAEFELGDYEEAARFLEAALAVNPFNAQASVQLADTYTRLGQPLRACEVLGNILSVDPGNMPLRFKLANCLFRAERPHDALGHLKELYKYDPGNADILVNMGTVYADMDSLQRAIESWERALVLDPDNDMARENLRLAEEENE
jgi:superkiller protein 3